MGNNLNLAKTLKENIIVIQNTFDNNIKVLKIGVKPYSEDDSDMQLLLEIESIDGGNLANSIDIKINLYDKDDELYQVNSSYLDEDVFCGYDTVVINCYDDGQTLQKAVKGKLYVTKS